MGAVQQVMLAQQIASSWTPNTPGNLVNWYDASTLGLANNAAVTSFTDSKGSNNLTSASHDPQYATNQQNGLGTVFFNGNQYLEIGGSNSSTFPYTIGAVVKLSNFTSAHAILGSSGNGGLEFRVDITTGFPELLKQASSSIGIGSSALSTSAYHLVVVTVTSGANPAANFYIDGTSAGSGTATVSLTASKTFCMGTTENFGTPGDIYAGYIGELLIWGGVLGSSDLSSYHTWTVAKWATP